MSMFPIQNGQQTHPKFVHKKNKIGQTKSNLEGISAVLFLPGNKERGNQ